jgi:hypothetical protein
MVKSNMLQLRKMLSLEHTDVVANALFLVLCDALGYPGDVANFLLLY